MLFSTKRPLRLALCTAAAFTAFACFGCEPEPEPVYDSDLDLQAVSVEPGAMAGIFAVKTNSLGIAQLPLIGEQFLGGNSFLLLERTWNADAENYTQTYKMCGGRIFDTEASTSFIPNEVWQLAETFPPKELILDHSLGVYEANDYMELWGVKDLPDPYTTPFPKDGEEAKLEPFASRIFDLENDGNPGATMVVGGAIEAEVFFIQRRFSNFKGLILSENEIQGLLEWEKTQITLDATNLLLNGNLDQVHHPDPKEAWFHEIRIAEDATCDTVLEAVETGLLSRLRPF